MAHETALYIFNQRMEETLSIAILKEAFIYVADCLLNISTTLMIDALMKIVVMLWLCFPTPTPSHQFDELELNFVHLMWLWTLFLLPVIDNIIKSFLLLFRLEKVRRTAFNLPVPHCLLIIVCFAVIRKVALPAQDVLFPCVLFIINCQLPTGYEAVREFHQ